MQEKQSRYENLRNMIHCATHEVLILIAYLSLIFRVGKCIDVPEW